MMLSEEIDNEINPKTAKVGVDFIDGFRTYKDAQESLEDELSGLELNNALEFLFALKKEKEKS